MGTLNVAMTSSGGAFRRDVAVGARTFDSDRSVPRVTPFARLKL